MSYPEVNFGNSPPDHQAKYREYVKEMAKLYKQNEPDMSFLNQMNADISSLKYQIVISCKRVVGRDNLTNPKVVALLSTFQPSPLKRTLDMTRDLQPYSPLRLSIAFPNFTTLRNNTNIGLMLSIEENLPPGRQPHQQPLRQFNLIIANTHPEGFDDWIDFGRGVRLLINVYYKVRDEANITSEIVSTFHLRTIEQMLRKRMGAFTATSGNLRPFHQMAAFKRNVCYRREYINRQTDSYFWPTSGNSGQQFTSLLGKTPSWFVPVSDVILTPRRDATTVRFIDMQIGFETNEDFEDRVCLCSEWCNWNAFFHHNPIYRFLMVRHHQLFMQNMSNIPDMYLCVPVLLGCVPVTTIKKPILQLMECANEYRKRYYHSFYLKHPNRADFQRLYANSHPQSLMMNGLTYNKLRNELKISELCHILDNNPLADICIENLINYYNVLISLHLYISSYPAFVINRRLWSQDLDLLGRNKYRDYFKQSYTKCMEKLIHGYDSLFTEDYEYSTQLPKTEEHRDIRDDRNRVRVSPFNLSVRTSVFLNTFVSVYKFLSRVEPILPKAYKTQAREHIMVCYRRLDIDFDGLRNANNYLGFELDSTRSGFNNLQQYFDLFYTLKLYFYSFEIQKHCIDSVIKYNKRMHIKSDQVSSTFNFIWNYEFIEQHFRNTYNGIVFLIEDFEVLFTAFYDTFWGRAQHETQQFTSLENVTLSAVRQYQRLYFWEQNNGYDRQKFARIMNSMTTCLTNTRQRSDQIHNHIWFTIAFLANTPGFPLTHEIVNRPIYPFGAEMMDHLIYYLVKANCSVILSTVAKFLKPMHALQLNQLVTQHICLSLCKPGWINLFGTMDTVLISLDDLKTRNIVYDDEFNRISNTCLQTKQMIKDIYRQFYQKLTIEWINELITFFGSITQPPPNLVQTAVKFMELHLVYGLSFCAFFVDHFRLQFATSRKLLIQRLNIGAQPHLQHQIVFTQLLPIVRNYLTNRETIALARPLSIPPWSQYMTQFITVTQQLTGEQLNIDLNEANI